MRDFARRNWLSCLVLGLALIGTMHGAHAATAGGGGLPWDTPLTTFRNDLTGPVAFSVSLLAMLACGVALVFGGEINAFTSRLILLVLICAFIVGVTNLASALGIAGAVV